MYPPLSNDITTASANDEYPALDYYNSPFLQDHDGVILSYLLSQQHFSTVADATSNNSYQPSQQAAELSFAEGNKELVKEMVKKTPISSKINNKKKKAAAPRKRASGKKDRHSKICTAQGQRDRRMRLSVQIARKFFDLQDMLGFDKASKTIEWLITKSKSAIKELKHHLVLPSYSTCTTESSEVVSNTLETRDPKNKHVRKFRRVAKGSRDEARARARERTREKLRIRSSQDHKANPNNDLGLCSEQGETNSLRMSNTNDQKTLTGRSSRSGPHFEEDGEFAGLTGNWGNIDSTRMQSFRGTMTTNVMKSSTGNSVLQIENPSTPIMGTTTTTRYTKQQEPGSSTSSLFSYTSSNYSQEQCYSGTSVFLTPPLNTQEVLDPCSVDFMPNQDQDHDHNHNSIFITTIISQNQNPGQFLKFNQDHFKFI